MSSEPNEVEIPGWSPTSQRGRTRRASALAAAPVPTPEQLRGSHWGAALVVIGAIVALAVVTHVWWTLVLALIVLGAMTYLVIAMIIKMTSNPERPSSTTVAAMEEEGVDDPEQLFSDVIAEFTAEPEDGWQDRQKPPMLWMIPRRRPRSSVTRRRRVAGQAGRSAPTDPADDHAGPSQD